MRPGENGEIILEGSRDAHYVAVGAKLVEDTALAEQVRTATSQAFGGIYRDAYQNVSSNDISATKMVGNRVAYQSTDVQKQPELHRKIAQQRAEKRLKTTEIILEPAMTPNVVRGLGALTTLGRFSAMRRGVRRPVAQELLDSIHKPSKG